MLLTVSDVGLAELLSSQLLMLQTWHDAAQDVMMLIHVLRTAMPTLADVLAVGLIMLTAPAACSILVMRHGLAAVTAVGRREDSSEVSNPQDCLREITLLEVRAVTVDDHALLVRAAS